MTLFKDKYRVESTRLPEWNYASGGYYFVTVCTHEKICCLGDINDGVMVLSPQGVIARKNGDELK